MHDHWYSATEARDYGFVDAITESFGQVMPSKKHSFGLRASAGVRQQGERVDLREQAAEVRS
jgi:ATP-dependent Clp protease protease subunit